MARASGSDLKANLFPSWELAINFDNSLNKQRMICNSLEFPVELYLANLTSEWRELLWESFILGT